MKENDLRDERLMQLRTLARARIVRRMSEYKRGDKMVVEATLLSLRIGAAMDVTNIHPTPRHWNILSR